MALLIKSVSILGRFNSLLTRRSISNGYISKTSSSSIKNFNIISERFFSSDHGHGHDAHKVPAKKKEAALDPNVPLPKKHEEHHLFPFEEGDYVPPTETHAVGDERAEIDFGPFDQTVLKGGFGSEKSPIEVPSRYHSRIVGCTGSADTEHEILWHEVKLGKDLVCMECGQFFSLRLIPGFEHLAHAHGHGHDEHHEEHPFHGHVDGDGFRFMYPPKTPSQIALEKAERDEELKKDPKAPVKKVKSTGVDYHSYEEETEEDRISSKASVFHDRRQQTYKDRK